MTRAKPATLVLVGIALAAAGVTLGVAATTDALFGECGVACTRAYGVPIAVAVGALTALLAAGGVALIATGVRAGLA